MNKHCWLTVVTMALQTFSSSNSFLTMVPVINKMNCKYNARVINLTCTLDQSGSIANQSITMEMVILREVKDVKLAAAYYVVSETGDSPNRLLYRTVDLCSFVRRPNSDRLVKVIFDLLKDKSRFVTKCPIARNEQFYIRDLRPASVQIPGFLPESNFILENSYHFRALNEPVVEVMYYGKLIRVMHDELQKARPKPSRLRSDVAVTKVVNMESFW